MSEQEQTQEPSLEEILTSIRKKIATGEEVPLTGAESPQSDAASSRFTGTATGMASAENAQNTSERNIASPASVDFAALGGGDTAAKKEVYPGRLSDMLGRISDDDLGTAQSQAIGNSDDLSDILDQPLPATDNVSDTTANANAAASLSYANDTAAEPSANSADVSFAQALGLATSNDPEEREPNTTDPDPAPNESLELTALEDNAPDAGILSDAGHTNSIELSQIPVRTSDDVPRVMTSLTSGFNIADSDDAASAPVTTIEVTPGNLDKPGEQAAVVVTSSSPAEATPQPSPSDSAFPLSATGPVPGTPQPAPAGAASAATAAVAAAAAGVTESAAAQPGPDGVSAAPKSLEDVVEAMLRPMLHKWLEENMPRIVENALRIEVLEGSKDDRG